MKYIFPIFIAAILAVQGCNIFATRDPASPNSSRPNFTTPTSPAIVIANLKSAIEEKNTENYMLCLDTAQFKFAASAQSLTTYPILSTWDISKERQAFVNLVLKMDISSLAHLTLANEKPDLQPPVSATLESDYSLSFYYSASTTASIYSGKLRFTFLQSNDGKWAISNWSDDGTNSGTKTWSDLKGELSR